MTHVCLYPFKENLKCTLRHYMARVNNTALVNAKLRGIERRFKPLMDDEQCRLGAAFHSYSLFHCDPKELT